MSTITISPNSEEGFIYATDATWSTAYGASTGTLDKLVSDTSRVYSTTGYQIDRGFMAFSLSTIPADATIISITLRLFCISYTGIVTYINQGTQSNTLVADDFNNVTTTNYGSYTGINDWQLLNISLNAAGIAYIQANIGGTAKFCLRDGYDHANSAPADTNNNNMGWRNQTWATAAQRPLLTVEYTTPGSGFIYMSV